MNAALAALSKTDAVPPYYRAQGNEAALFEHAWQRQLPVLIKGPTGCSKTRFVAHMAARFGRPLITVACHDDLTAVDLVGRHLIGESGTCWCDGPLSRAVREGAICYLDEVVEARKDTTVMLLMLYLKNSDAPPLARNHLRQTVTASLWAGVLLVLINGMALLFGGVNDPATWVVVILYFVT